MTAMNVLSLFSGIGGLDLGLERAGMTIVGQVEIDPWCRKVLAQHWPEVPRHDDVRTCADWWGDRAAPDLVCGGFPCQPVSYAGKGLAQDDERWLWPAFADVVRCLRPAFVLVENVPGLLGRGMGDVLGDLAACGYDAEWDCVPAAAVGAPHIRDRVWIIAYPHRSQLREQPGRRDGQSRPGAPLAGDDGTPQHVADPQRDTRDARRAGYPSQGTRGRTRWRAPEPGERHSGGGPVSDWWAAEPDVGRVASRLSTGMDGDLNAHESCLTKARTAGVPQTERLRALRQHLATPEASSEPPRCHLCGHPLSALPCRGACAPWHLGSGGEEAEDLRCVREGLLGLLARQGQDLRPHLSFGAWTAQREQAVGDRTDRLRGLGNAVVPQVAEQIGRMIMEAAA